MTKHGYFHRVLRRRNILLESILDFFLALASYPRLVLEVFIRKNFGRRYFSLASCITVTLLLVFIPIFQHRASVFLTRYYSHNSGVEPPSFLLQYTTWYLFTAGFIYCCILRWKEIRKEMAINRFRRFTLYPGDLDLRFFKIKLFGETPSVRTVKTIYEPALFFIAGLVLTIAGQKVGALLQWCSIFYSLGWIGAFKKGDDFMDDTHDDDILCKEKSAFVNNEINNKKGVRYCMHRPDSRQEREEVFEKFLYKDNAETTYVS